MPSIGFGILQTNPYFHTYIKIPLQIEKPEVSWGSCNDIFCYFSVMRRCYILLLWTNKSNGPEDIEINLPLSDFIMIVGNGF